LQFSTYAQKSEDIYTTTEFVIPITSIY